MSILQSGPNPSYWIILSRIRFRFFSVRRVQFHSLQINNEKRPFACSDDTRDSSVALGRKVFVISNIGQHKILEGAAGSPLAGKPAAECVLLKLSGISALRHSGRAVSYTR